jgi:hypothetical protein
MRIGRMPSHYAKGGRCALLVKLDGASNESSLYDPFPQDILDV